MAAIIAQLTRAARRKRSRKTYGTNKCLYTLEPFDRNGFNPVIHNRWSNLIKFKGFVNHLVANTHVQ